MLMQGYCGIFFIAFQALIITTLAASGCESPIIRSAFGEILALPTAVGTALPTTNCSWTFEQPQLMENAMMVMRMVVLRNYKDPDVFLLPDGQPMPATNLRVWNVYTPEPQCFGFVKKKSEQHTCFDRLAQVCNNTFPKLATSWPPRITVSAGDKAQFLFSFAFLECPKAPTYDPAPAVLGVLLAVTFLLLAILVYMIMRKKYIKRESRNRSTNEYATPTYQPMPDVSSRQGTLQPPPPSLPARSISVQSQMSSLEVVSQQSVQSARVPVSDTTATAPVQRQISDPKTKAVGSSSSLAPLGKTPLAMAQQSSATTSAKSENGGPTIYQNSEAANALYELPIRKEQVEYLDFNDPEGESGSGVYVKHVREA